MFHKNKSASSLLSESFNYKSNFNTKILDIDLDGDNDILLIPGLIGTLGEMEPQLGNNIEVYFNENGTLKIEKK